MGDSWDKLPSPMEDGGDDYGCEYLHDVSWLRALNFEISTSIIHAN